MIPNLGRLGGLAIPTHDAFVALGVLVAALVFAGEVRRRLAYLAVLGLAGLTGIGWRLAGWLG